MNLVQASNLSFEDYDLDATDLGGTLTWTLAENEVGKQVKKKKSSSWWWFQTFFILGSGLRHPFSGDPKLAESLGGLIAGFGFHV